MSVVTAFCAVVIADALLDVLEERVLDSSSYTRAAVLRAWCALSERGVLPVARTLAAACLAAGRLKDKSAITRRAAVQLLSALLERNPYTGALDPAPYAERAKVSASSTIRSHAKQQRHRS